MPVPGYDPEDLDDVLESLPDEAETASMLGDAEWRAYRNDEERLVDLLDEAEIERLLDDRDGSDDAAR